MWLEGNQVGNFAAVEHWQNDEGLPVRIRPVPNTIGLNSGESGDRRHVGRHAELNEQPVGANIRLRRDQYDADTEIHSTEIWSTSRLVSSLTGMDVQRNKAIVGENAFSHEAGIHQHGVIEDRRTYEILKAEDVGWSGQQLVIGKHSGARAVAEILKGRGFSLNKEQLRSAPS